MLKSQTGVLVGHIFANAAEEKIYFFENGSRRGDSGPGPEFWTRRFGKRNRSANFERRTRNMCPGTQVSVSECVMQKRFPDTGELYICNTLRVSGLGGREKRDGLRMICHDSGLPYWAITAPLPE